MTHPFRSALGPTGAGLLLALLVAPGASALAAPAVLTLSDDVEPLTMPEPAAGPSHLAVAHDLDIEWGFVANATTHGKGAHFHSGAEQSSLLRYVFSPQITPRVLLHFGAEWQRIAFGAPDHAPVPNSIQDISAILGLDWQITDRWLLRTEFQPGVYSDFQDVSSSDLDAPLLLSAAYLANPDLQWFLGLRLDPRSHYPVIPAVGLRWKFADEWTLNAVLPRPRLQYDFSDRLQTYLGAGIEAGTFRMGQDFGDARRWHDLNGSILDYFEVRVGPGFSWKIRPPITIEADAGYMVYRRFDFSDRHVVFRSDPAPYFQLACRFRF